MLKRISCALSLAVVLFAQQATPPSRAVDLLITKARSLEARGRADLAAQAWQQLLMIEPDQQDALAGLARIAKLQGKSAESESYLGRLRKVNPASASLAQVETTSTVRPRNPELEAAGKLAESGQTEQAIAAYKKSFGGNPPPAEWLIPFNETLASTPGGWEQATASLDEALRRSPASQDIKVALGRLYTYRPATRLKGVALLESVTGPLAVPARQAWRQALIWEEGSARSAESLRAYIARYPDPDLKTIAEKQPARPQTAAGGEDLKRAWQAMKNEDLSTAEKQFDEALKKNPRSSEALAGMGFLHMKQQDFPAALKSFEAAAALAPQNKAIRDGLKEARFWVAMNQGAEALKSARSEDAVELFKKAVAERPSSTDAMEGYAGALMQRGEYATALPVLERLVKADSTRVRSWKDLIIAKQHTSGAQSALDVIAQIPAAVSSRLNGDIEYLIALTGAQQRAGQSGEATKTFARAAALVEKSKQGLPLYLELQLASLYLNFEDAAHAVKHYLSAVRREPANLDAWEGFLIASERTGSYGTALQTLEGLPSSVHEAAQARPGFLRAVASLEARVGSLSSAESLLLRAQDIETRDGKDASFYTQLQMAQLWLEQGKAKQAADKMSELAQSYPENEEVWKGLILGLHKSGASQQAADTIRRIPASVANALGGDADYITAVAALYQETQGSQEATQFLRESAARLTADGRSLPPSMTIQLGWLLLDTPGTERELFVLLRNARTRTDFTTENKRTLNDIWTAWLTRSADDAKANGDPKHAISILEAGIRMLPSEVRLQRALAANLLSAGDAKRAFAIYQASGMRNAVANDYVAAIGAAMAAEETRIAENWLRQALTTFPNDVELLSLAGKQAAGAGDFKKAESLWRLALKQVDIRAQEKLAESIRSGPDGIRILQTGDPTDDAGTVLLSGTGSAQPSSAPAPLKYKLPWDTGKQQTETLVSSARKQVPEQRNEVLLSEVLAVSGPAAPAKATLVAAVDRPAAPKPQVPTTKETLTRMLDAVQTPQSQSELKRSLQDETKAQTAAQSGTFNPRSSKIEDLLPSTSNISLAALLEPRTSVVSTPEEERIADRIKTVEGRNSPYLGLGGNVVSRSGQPGFERMMLQESILESSTVTHGSLRATVIARSVFAEAAGPDGLSLYRFGMLPQGDTFEAPGVSGFGAEAQVSGNNFGMRFGATPRGFAVQNFIGGFRFRPAGGPITLTFDRDSIKDTILSYAGQRDPVSRRVWGGVIANTGNATGNFGNEKSGVYFNLGFQHITGESVETNRRIDGTLGTYWRLVYTPAGSLNGGVNLFAMHYAKNLRYFTVGHGGYFSPQRFLLFNVPVTWTGKAKRLEYVIGTSIGSQSFTENASPYFPVDPLMQGATGQYYPSLSSSGINYNVDFRAAYQVAENWFLVGFLNVNNARFYSQQSAGVSIRYSFRPRPLESDLTIPSIPDWRGRQPFGLR